MDNTSYRKGYSERYVTAMNDFMDNSPLNRRRELLDENNYNRRGAI
ncbi:MAG: hypothetical protein RE471_05815 [Ferroplasma sp.]|nr:hypothetical protein [Ferroplasma sp.]WMT50497.1 MAG: hypothetical protein RE471_05815 [Ferroplasma sp.]